MQTVRQIAQQIVDREGGYVNDLDDPGGATNFGVTFTPCGVLVWTLIMTGMWTNTMCRC